MDQDQIADLGLALFVVGVKPGVGGDDFLVFGVGIAALDFDDDGLGHLVGNDPAQALFALAADDWVGFGHKVSIG